MCDPILVTVLKMQPHYSQSSRENATPSSGTSPVASYKEVPPPPGDNEANHLLIDCLIVPSINYDCLNCIRHGGNATYEPSLRYSCAVHV